MQGAAIKVRERKSLPIDSRSLSHSLTMAHTDIAIRMDGTDCSRLLEFFELDGGAYFCVREDADSGSHFHAVLRTDRKINAVRTAWKRHFPELTGNGSHSIVIVRDLDKYHRYMCKGASPAHYPEVCGANGIQYQDLEWQNAQHEAYWSENARTAGMRKKLPIPEAVYQACRDANVSWFDKEGIAKIYIRELVSRDRAINTFAVRSSVQLIQVKLCPDETALEDLARSVACS